MPVPTPRQTTPPAVHRTSRALAAATVAAALMLAACSGSGGAVAGESDPACAKASAEHTDAILASIANPPAVKAAYEVTSKQYPGLTLVTVAFDGFPPNVPARNGEVPAPTYAFYEGDLYTASGQAIRFSTKKQPLGVTDSSKLAGAGQDPAANASFDCTQPKH